MSRQANDAQKWVGVQEDGQVNSAAGWSPQGISQDRVRSGMRDHTELSDYFLVDLTEGLVKFPQGDDRGILTVAIEFAQKHGHNHVTLSQTQGYIRQHRLTGSRLSGTVTDADTIARGHHFPPAGAILSEVQGWWKAGGFKHD